MRNKIAIVVTLLFCASAAVAQIPTTGNVFLGYAYNRGSAGFTTSGNMNGWEGSLEGKIFPHIALVADYSDTTGTLSPSAHPMDIRFRVQSFLFGPRVYLSVGRFRPFAHVLIGASRMHQYGTYLGITHDTSYANAIGGGVDWRLIPHVALRVQGDALRTSFTSDHQNDFRFATGPVIRF